MDIAVNSLQTDRSWEKIVMKYNKPNLAKSIWQISNTLLPYALVWFLLYKSLSYPYWVTLLLTILASGFLIRLFIFFHDCGHKSFFKSKQANDIVGKILGIIVYTPYSHWNHNHAIHHATSGNLDKRGLGDVWTLTVEEYMEMSKKERFKYKLYRHPFILVILGAVYVSLIKNRLTTKKMTPANRMNVYVTNIGILIMAVSLSLVMGVKAYLLIQLPIVVFAYILGHWLFYVQHQYEEMYWEKTPNWDYKTAAVEGSSYLKLPAVLQWFTGNIGFHHVHHLSSKIPNYNLQRCHNENELFNKVKPLTFWGSFKTFKLRLWDEASQQMVSFSKVGMAKG